MLLQTLKRVDSFEKYSVKFVVELINSNVSFNYINEDDALAVR